MTLFLGKVANAFEIFNKLENNAFDLYEEGFKSNESNRISQLISLYLYSAINCHLIMEMFGITDDEFFERYKLELIKEYVFKTKRSFLTYCRNKVFGLPVIYFGKTDNPIYDCVEQNDPLGWFINCSRTTLIKRENVLKIKIQPSDRDSKNNMETDDYYSWDEEIVVRDIDQVTKVINGYSKKNHTGETIEMIKLLLKRELYGDS